MADTGFKLPQSVQEVAGIDNDSWTNPTNLTTDSTATVAYNDLPKRDYSDFLVGYNYDFSAIPSGATITGIEVQIEHRGESTTIEDAVVQLYDNTTSTGDDKGTDASIGTAWVSDTYGGSTDTWNASLTDTDVKTSTFGVGVQYYNDTTPNTARWVEVNTIRVKIYYETTINVTAEDTSGNTITSTCNGGYVTFPTETSDTDPFNDSSCLMVLPLDSDYDDITTNNHDGTLVAGIGDGALTTGDGGKFDEGYVTTDAGSKITIGGFSGLAWGDVGALSLWLNYDDRGTSSYLFQMSGTTQDGLYIRMTDTTFDVYVENSSGTTVMSCNSSFNAGDLQGYKHIVVNFPMSATATSGIEIWVDNVETTTSSSYTGTAEALAGTMALMNGDDSASYTTAGYLDHPMLFNKNLDAGEIASLGAMTLATAGTDVTVIETGVTLTGTANAVTVVTDQVLTDTGSTATFTANEASVSGDSLFVDSTGSSVTLTTNDTTVTGDSLYVEVGVTLSSSVNDPTILVVSSATGEDTTGSTITFTVNEVVAGVTALIEDTGVTLTSSVNDATALTDQVLTDTGVTATFAVNDPTYSLGLSVTDTGVTVTSTVNDVVVLAGGAITAVDTTGSTLTSSLNDPTVTGDSIFADTGVTVTSSINAPTVTGDSLLVDTGVTVTSSVNDVTVQTVTPDALVEADVITATFAVNFASVESYVIERPTTSTGQWNDPTYAYDDNDATRSWNSSSDSTHTWSGFGSISHELASLELNITYELTESNNDTMTLEYSLDGGLSWETPIYDGASTVVAKNTDVTVLSATQDVSDIQVRTTYDRQSPLTGTPDLYMYEIWVEGEIDNSGAKAEVDPVTATFDMPDLVVIAIQNVTIVDTGVTLTTVSNEVTAGVFTLAPDLTGATITSSMNDVTVYVEMNAVDSTGNTLTMTVNDTSILIDIIAIDSAGSTITSSINSVTVDVSDTLNKVVYLQARFMVNDPQIYIHGFHSPNTPEYLSRHEIKRMIENET